MNCQWLRLIRESAYKTAVTPTTVNTDYVAVELLDDDPVSIEPVANNEPLMSWLACGARDRTIGETETIEGTIRTLLYPAQVPLLFGWWLGVIADQDVEDEEFPWVTSEPPGQLASMAADYGYVDDDGTERKGRLLGGKVTGGTLTFSRGTRQGAGVLELNTRWSSLTSTGTSAPPAADYPSQSTAPYYLSATSGNLSINGEVAEGYDDLAIAAAYETSARYDESPTVRRIRHNARDFTMTLGGLLRFDPDWRALQRARTTFPASVTLEYPGGTGAQSVAIDFGNNAIIDEWSRALPIRNDRTQSITIASQFNRTTGAMLTYTVGVQA